MKGTPDAGSNKYQSASMESGKKSPLRIKATWKPGNSQEISGNLENGNLPKEIKSSKITPRKDFPTVMPLSPWFPNSVPKRTLRHHSKFVDNPQDV